MDFAMNLFKSTPLFVENAFVKANKIINTIQYSVKDRLCLHYFKEEGTNKKIILYNIFQCENYSYPRFSSLKKEETSKYYRDSEVLLSKWNYLWNQCFGQGKDYSYTLSSIPFEKVLVINDNKQTPIAIGGYIRMSHNIIQVQSLAVDPNYRRTGLGTQILVEIIKKVPDTIVIIGILKDAPVWQHGYSKYGFREISEYDKEHLDTSGSWILSTMLSNNEKYMILNPYIKK